MLAELQHNAAWYWSFKKRSSRFEHFTFGKRERLEEQYMAHCQQNVVRHSQDNLFARWYLRRSPRRKIDLVKTFRGGRTSFENFRERWCGIRTTKDVSGYIDKENIGKEI